MRAPHLLSLFLFLILASSASAQAGATVEVTVTGADGSPSEAEVTLSPRGGGPARSCQTREGRCSIAGVPTGRYVVRATPRGAGAAPLAQVVWVPEGVPRVEVRVRLR